MGVCQCVAGYNTENAREIPLYNNETHRSGCRLQVLVLNLPASCRAVYQRHVDSCSFETSMTYSRWRPTPPSQNYRYINWSSLRPEQETLERPLITAPTEKVLAFLWLSRQNKYYNRNNNSSG